MSAASPARSGGSAEADPPPGASAVRGRDPEHHLNRSHGAGSRGLRPRYVAAAAMPHPPATTSRLLLAVAIALACAGVLPGGASAAVRVDFLQGEQNVSVVRPGTTVEDALEQLLAGPTRAEAARQIRTYIPRGTRVRSVEVRGRTAIVDLSARLVAGNDAPTLLARLSQVVGTVAGTQRVTRVRVRVQGGTPLGLFPGVDATRALTPKGLGTPDVAPPRSAPASHGGDPTDGTLGLQRRLVELGFLDPAWADGRAGPATTTAVIGFQKWEGLGRDGVAGPQTNARLATATRPRPIRAGGPGRRVEVLIDRQLVLAIQDDRVVRAIAVSTGKPSTPTPTGSFDVYGKYPRWWSTPFQEYLLWAAPFVGGVAMHQYPEVPVYAASHGCVRVTQYDARWLFDFVSVGTPVRVLARSR